MDLFKDVDKLIPLGKNKRTAKSLEEERLPEESTRATSSKKSPGAKSDDEKKVRWWWTEHILCTVFGYLTTRLDITSPLYTPSSCSLYQ